MKKQKVAVLGGSRGLGEQLVLKLVERGCDTWSASRKPTVGNIEANWRSFDFSLSEQWQDLVTALDEFNPSIIIYTAGGGPYGQFGQKKWTDHSWALNVTFQCPAFLLWSWCRGESLIGVEKFVLIGSQVAEAKPDPLAAMYCASKHALKGLADTLISEYPDKDLFYFSAPYMDTAMLPPGAWPRRQAGLVRPPSQVAEEILDQVLI